MFHTVLPSHLVTTTYFGPLEVELGAHRFEDEEDGRDQIQSNDHREK